MAMAASTPTAFTPAALEIGKGSKQCVPPSPALSACSTQMPDSSDDLLQMVPDTPMLEKLSEMMPEAALQESPELFVAKSQPVASTSLGEVVLLCFLGAIPACCFLVFGVFTVTFFGGLLICAAPATALVYLISGLVACCFLAVGALVLTLLGGVLLCVSPVPALLCVLCKGADEETREQAAQLRHLQGKEVPMIAYLLGGVFCAGVLSCGMAPQVALMLAAVPWMLCFR